MFIWLYRVIFVPIWLASVPAYWLHVRKRGGYRERFGTRFGLGLEIPEKRDGALRIWIQAVSLGEMLAIEPLLRALADDKRIEIYLTATTSTGYALAREKYGELAVGISYFPVDFYPFSKRVWDAIRPDLAICAETELWPEHIQQAHRRGVPLLLVNARLSDRSFRRAMPLRWLIGGTLKDISMIYACSEFDRERFCSLGVPEERLETTGNIKVDISVEAPLGAEERAARRRELGVSGGFLLLGSSTWPGEEEMLLAALAALRQRDASARLLIVPRHGERRQQIEAVLRERAQGFRWHFKSRGLPEGEVDILVADTHGELRRLTQLTDVAFIGKSLPPHSEGQTPVECGALGVPMLFGPGMSNFRSIREGLLQFGAARQVGDADEAVAAIVELSQDEAARREMGASGRRWHQSSRGAVARTVAGVLHWLKRGESRKSEDSSEASDA